MKRERTRHARKPVGPKALRHGEELLTQAVELANVGSWEIDLEKNELRWSPQFFRLMGIPPRKQPMPPDFYVDFIHPDDREEAMKRVGALRRDGTRSESEIRFVTPTRGVRIFHTRSVAIRDKTGSIVGLRGMSQDVTEQREAERVLREREALLAHAEQLANMGSYRYDHGMTSVTPSANLNRIYGFASDVQWTRADFWERVHPEDREWARKLITEALEAKQPFEFVSRFLHPERGVRVLHTRGVPISNDPRDEFRRVGVVRDITEQYEVEQRLREHSAMLEYAEKVAKLGSWRYDYATDSFTLSPNMRRILGIGPDDSWSGELYWSRVPQPDRARAQEIFGRATQEQKPFEFIARFAPMNGGMAHLRTRGITFCDAAGKLTHRVGVVQDITEQYEVEQKMRESEALLTNAEQVRDFGFWLYELDSRKMTMSPQMRTMYGLREGEEWNSESCWQRVHPEDRPRVRAVMARAAEAEQPFEFIMRFTPQGASSTRHFFVRGAPVTDSAGRVVRRAGVVQDVTVQHEGESKLREREALLTQAEEIANLGSWKYEFETNTLTLSPQLRKIYGIGPNDEWTNDTYWSRVHPSDRATVQELLNRATAEKQPFECSARFLPLEGDVRHLHLRAVPVLDAAGKLIRRVGVAQDITDQVKAETELRRLSQQLLRTQDEERRNLARELHETAGQSLAALKMTLGRLRDTMTEADDLAHALLKSAAELADAAVREVRTVSYLMHPPMLDEAGLAPALRWYARGFEERSGIHVTTEIPERLPRQTREIETTIFRIVQEALTNVHRYSESRTAQIRVWCAKGEIHAEVSDQGRGLTPSDRAWSKAEGLGVGIAGMRERVAQLKGIFELQTVNGQGALVRVTLPGNSQPAAGRRSERTRVDGTVNPTSEASANGT